MTLQTISVDISPRRIATVTLNRPERGNAFDQTMLDELGGSAQGAGGRRQCPHRRAARRRQAFLHRRRPRLARAERARRSRRSRPNIRCATCSRSSTACPSPPSRWSHGGAIGGGAGLGHLLRRGDRHARGVLLDPGSPGRHGADRHHAVHDPRHRAPRVPALRTVGRAHRRRGRACGSAWCTSSASP